MAKTKTPYFGLGARGSVGQSITAQKRGLVTILRSKPFPTDPRSLPQLAQRQKYRDAVAVWNAFTPEEKQAWHGVCPGLTGYQCFLRSELKYAPPLIILDIGAEAIDREGSWAPTNTLINKDNPAEHSGTITSIEIWAHADFDTCVVGTFYTTDVDTLKCRDSEAIPGIIPAGSKVTKPVSLSVEIGDYIGTYYTGGRIKRDLSGYAGVWYKLGEYIDPGDEMIYILAPGDVISLYGTGEAAA
ncbi:hypothetical protein ES705_16736 [subsurface metagenome]